MRTFAQKQNQPQRQVSSNFARSKNHPASPLLHLQRTGSQAAQRVAQTNAENLKAGSPGTASPRLGHDFSQIPLHAPTAGAVQTKLAINKPGDANEQEADHVSEQVMHAQEPQQDANKIETARDPDSGISVATDPSRLRESYFRGDHQQAARIVQSNKGLGVPLMPRVQLQMKDYLGHDFSDVRIHTDSFARQAVESLDANAFTVQRDIFFSANMYAPDQSSGIRRLAHELVHTVQQRNTGGPPSEQQISALETQAERVATQGVQCASALKAAGPCILREPTFPRATTGDGMAKEVVKILSLQRDKKSHDETTRLWSNVETNFPASITAGSLARKVWTHIFFRHFVEPDQRADIVESAHPRYMFSHKYGWIDAQHFFGFIDFAEQFHLSNPKNRQKAFDQATKKGLKIEETQWKVREHMIKPPPSTSAQEPEGSFEQRREEVRKEAAQEAADRFALLVELASPGVPPDPRKINTMIEVVSLLNEKQKEKFWIDMAKSAFTYEDFESNQLGTRFYFEYGVKINNLPEKDRTSAFISNLGSFFKSIDVENDQKILNNWAASLPGKERFNAPKTTEAQVRKEHPDLFKLP